jgi:hypothetical protein
MKKIYYYIDKNSPELVLCTISTESWDEISKKLGLSRADLVVEKIIEPNLPTEEYLKMYYMQYLRWNQSNTDIEVDTDKLQEAFLEELRKERSKKLEELDILAIRAISKNLIDVAQEIDSDKQILRDLPLTINFKFIDNLKKFWSLKPPELLVDYYDKYKSRL